MPTLYPVAWLTSCLHKRACCTAAGRYRMLAAVTPLVELLNASADAVREELVCAS